MPGTRARGDSRALRRVATAFGRFLAELIRAQHRDQLFLRAAALAYTTLLSLVPLLTVALALVARVQPQRAELIVTAIAAIFPFSSQQVTATLATFAERAVSLGWAAIFLSALVTFNAFFQIEEVMNSIWGVPARRKLRWRVASFLAVLLWGPLLLAALFSFLYWLQSHPTLRTLAPFTRPLPALFAFMVLAALYRWVPHARVPWRAVAVGAAVAAAALSLIHLGFQVYLDLATGLNVVYGSLAIVLFFLVSLFLFWFAVLLGAEASWVVGRPAAPAEPRGSAGGGVLGEDAQLHVARDVHEADPAQGVENGLGGHAGGDGVPVVAPQQGGVPPPGEQASG
mgnify:CR=1 FL=1